jgi:hypothetical protein
MATVPTTAFKKGEKRQGQGRPKGVLNKNNQAIRDMIAAALDQVGGVEYLAERANDPKKAMALSRSSLRGRSKAGRDCLQAARGF